ncbi:MAG: SH3 domain-containing protein, partial [Pseudomonadales bacterium]
MFAPTPGTVMRDAELKAKPSLDAQTLGELPERTPVTIVDRHGGWFEVVRGDTRGWVRLLHVSSQPPGTHGPIPPELERAARVATGREGGGNIVVTTGTRGLTEEQLRQAEANTDELRRLEAQGVDARQAERHAARHGLQRRDIAYPPDPQGANG